MNKRIAKKLKNRYWFNSYRKFKQKMEKLDKILQNMDTLYERLKPVPNRDIEDFE